jgi:photosystem II stability/assembly factor-like uncharacterized protein
MSVQSNIVNHHPHQTARRWTARIPALLLVGGLAAGHAAPAPAAGYVRWTPVSQGLSLGQGEGIREVSMGGNPAVTYAIVDATGMYRSKDLGQTWTRLAGQAAPLRSPYAVAASPADGNVVYAAGQSGGGLWRSTDGGASWKPIGGKASGMASDDVEWITLSAECPELILVGHQSGDAISVSSDAGKTWRTSPLGAEVQRQVPLVVGREQWLVVSRQAAAMRYTEDGGKTWTAASGNADYFAGPLPVIQTGAYLFASSHHGTTKSTDGGKTWAYTMERHARVVGTIGSLLVREDRSEIYGEPARRLAIHVSSDYANSWEDVTGGLCDLVPAALQSNIVIRNSVDPFAHVRMASAWCSAPDQRTAFLGLGKAGLYRATLLQTKRGPQIVNPKASPSTLAAGDSTARVTLSVMASPRTGAMQRVYADLGGLGRGELELFDDGRHDDGQAGDGLYANSFTLPPELPPGEKSLGIVAEDQGGRVSSVRLGLKIADPREKIIVWDGDKFAHGQGWCGPAGGFSFIKPQSEEAHNGNVALEVHCEVNGGWMGGGWNWYGWYPPGSGSDIRGFRNLSFWAKAEGDKKRNLNVSLLSGSDGQTGQVDATEYGLPEGCDLLDGQWHEVVVPLADLYAKKDLSFDAAKAWQMNFNTWGPKEGKFSVYIDEIGFDNRPARAHSQWITAPEPRKPVGLGTGAAGVTATVDVLSAGKPISPYIYGASMGDVKAALEMGLTARRVGGNPITPFNWKTGFSAKGADWFYQNEGTESAPEQTWVARFHGENRKAALETYFSMPTMGRVAKDGTSAAFDTRKYPDQESWAGKAQPTDRLPYAGNGRQLVKGDDGKPLTDKNGKWLYRDIEPDPNATSIAMSPEEQTDFLRFMIEKMGYKTAGQGGIRFIALDNEPGIWHATHRGMHPKGCSYDELWERTQTYATLLKKIDPGVKIAAPTAWGWTEYLMSGLDSQLVGQGKGTWENPPDFAAHGGEFLGRWLLKKLKAHEAETGVRLVDLLDFHFYPQTGIYMAGQPNDPAVMEGRVQETRVLWDPTWKDPSWMGKETGHVIQLIRMMKKWIDECNPGLGIALGEYNFGGEKDVSGGVAQAEVLGIFAREGVQHAYFWFFPEPNSSPYFAFKMFRNPDGRHTAFGDRYLASRVSAPDDVSLHAARDSKTGRVTLVLVNKRAAKAARVALNFNAPVPPQKLVVYEYSAANKHCIGQWPDKTVQGSGLEIDLPPLSVLRFDLKM